MPRKSTRTQPTEVPEGERRVTRRSLQPPAAPEPEKTSSRAASKAKAPKPAPSSGRGRGKGRGSTRGRKAKKDEEEEAEEVEPEDVQSEKDDKDSETGAGDTTEKPAKGKGRGRGKKAAAAASPVKDAEGDKEAEEPEEESKVEEDVTEAKEETVTPKKGRGRRSAGASPAKAETPPSSGRSSRTRSPRKLPEETPTRRSGRSRRSGATDEETTHKKEEQPEETEGTESTGQKRKREDSETEEVAEKKQKVEEPESESQTTDEAMEVDESKTTDTEKEEIPAEPEEKPKTPSKEKEEPKPEEKPEAATYPSADEPEKAEEAQSDAVDAMDTAPPKEEEKEPDMSEYVMVNKDEIPPADSSEVVNALPQEKKSTEEAKEAEPESASPVKPSASESQAEPKFQPVSVIQEPVSAQSATPVQSSDPPTENGEENGEQAVNASKDTDNKPADEQSKDMAAPSNNIDSEAQESGATIPDPLFQRQYVANPNIDPTLAADDTRKFSVVSYNILADCHAPLSKYPWITPDHLSQEYRHKKLLQELQFLDADIFCLQEVGREYYENTLKPTLNALGYEGSYMKRIDDNIGEGEATFVRTSRFTVLSQKGFALRDLANKELANSGLENGNLDAVKRFVDKPSVFIISQLKCNNTGCTVTVGNIHVSWEQLAKPDLQCIEVADAVKELVATATPQGSFLICGDFNSWPGTPVYQLTKEGYLSDNSVSELQGVNNVRMADGSLSPLINLWWKGFQHTATNMKSAYHHVLGNEPHTTRYPHNGWVKQVDFVWYSGNTLDTAGVLQAVNQDKLTPGIPNASFPSDHISLKTDLVLKP